MSKHTPGPWSVPHFARPEVNCQCGYVLCDHLMGAICTVHCSDNPSVESGDNPLFEAACANARLIAAAPELLEACARAEKFIDAILSFYGQGLAVIHWHKNGDSEPLDNFIDDNSDGSELETLRAAIAKATAESP